jgi:hypothetical protein
MPLVGFDLIFEPVGCAAILLVNENNLPDG